MNRETDFVEMQVDVMKAFKLLEEKDKSFVLGYMTAVLAADKKVS